MDMAQVRRVSSSEAGHVGQIGPDNRGRFNPHEDAGGALIQRLGFQSPVQARQRLAKYVIA